MEWVFTWLGMLRTFTPIELLVVVAVALTSQADGLAAAGQEEYEIGGPLAGVKLPLFPTECGEPRGYPGCIPELQAAAREMDPKSREWTPQGQAPQLQLYDGSVENWRAYWLHYMPIRSMFDRQSQLKNFVAPDIPGATRADAEEYAAPVTWLGSHGPFKYTGRFRKPVPVIRCRVMQPVFQLDFGELDRGMYCVRVIGAVETKNLRSFLRPAWWRLKVNDGLKGEVSEYRVRVPYVDEFYSFCEIYFHAPKRRRYRAELFVDYGSEVEFLIHNISLDDALAGCERRRIKQFSVAARTVRPAPPEKRYAGKPAPLPPEERLLRDEAIWKAFPPINKPGIYDWYIGDGGMKFGYNGRLLDDINREYGVWEDPGIDYNNPGAFLVNRKLNLVYTMDDLAANKPLPDPYPYKDDGQGLYWLSPTNPDKPEGRLVFCPIALAVDNRIYRLFFQQLRHGGQEKVLTGEAGPDFARDEAIRLIAFAYQYPAQDANHEIQFYAQDPFTRGRNILRRRHTVSQGACGWYHSHAPLECYDRLFDYIKGNEDLAKSVGRFVPWVKTSDDVLMLLDVYLLQTMAKRYLRYHYYGDGREPEQIAEVATLAGNPDFTRPWMDWWFSRVFYYPIACAGIQDLTISGTDRDGRSPIGSFGYMIGEFAADRTALYSAQYVENGGDAKYDLRNPERYPKSIAALYFDFRMRTAGVHFPRFGSGSGADKGIYAGFRPERALLGWRWTKDPQFAYIIRHYVGRKNLGEAEWQEIEAAAAKVKRPLWFEQRSRFMPTAGAFLESGVEHDDFRFRRSVWVRTAMGQGHHHSDTLDLQMHAHGLPVIADSGQRRDTAYSTPHDTQTRVHNVVAIGEHNWMGYAWPRTISDAAGARYLVAQAVPQAGTRLYRRQVALLDVDEGQGSRPLGPAQFNPEALVLGDAAAALPKDVVTPNSYVFDVFRVSGGKDHTYCFRATVSDPNSPQPVLNLPGLKPLPASGKPDDALAVRAAAWLAQFQGTRLYGSAPAQFDVTFPLLKTRQRTEKWAGYGSEEAYLGKAYDPTSPAKFVKLHLFDATGLLFMKGDQHTHARDYWMPYVYLQKAGDDLESAFVAIIEPYAGEPFIADKQALTIADNDGDALRAAAVQLTLRGGRTDICFADGRPERIRQFKMPNAECKSAGEFAYHSTDADGLRQATLTGGTLLETPFVKIQAAAREHRATVARVDYLKKSAWLDATWPTWSGESRLVEIGTLPESGKEGYVTSYMATSCVRDGDCSRLTFLRGADYYRSRIKDVDEKEGVVHAVLPPPFNACPQAGINRNLTASSEAMTKFWRADITEWSRDAGSCPFRLSGGLVAEKDFAPENALRLWEYGVGDTARLSTCVNVRRVEKGLFLLEADVACRVGLQARAVRISADGRDFQKARAKQEGRLCLVEITERDLGPEGKLWLRVE